MGSRGGICASSNNVSNYLVDYLGVDLLLAVEHLAAFEGHYFADNNNQYLDLVWYYYYVAVVDQNYYPTPFSQPSSPSF
uniref:Uncharacterized protein n=1 Tax=Romanomermis culicivorax TaxID=13658 RepID=A0A915KYC8_ROMCU